MASRSNAIRARLHSETWIWADLVSNSNGLATYRALVPNIITHWTATVFAISSNNGLSVASQAAELRVVKPFFIHFNLPYSVKQGEILAVKVIAINYHINEQTVKLTLERDEFCGFDFVDFLEASDRDQNQRKPLNIRVVKVRGGGSGSSATVHFLIRPTVIGTMKLIVRAVGNDVLDVIEQNLPVEGEGFPIYVNKPLLLDVSVQDKFQTTLKMDLPPATALVRGSERAEISVVGDIMGVSLNLEELIRMPLGCGEQNMMKLVPNIVIWKYLNATGRLTNELSTKLRNFLESGYQQQLTYMHNDYSFSAFGQSDRQGSTWLTAFVVQWLKQAEPIIYVDPNILQNSLKFLQLQQKETGEFEEFGEVHIKSLHGGTASTSVALTAYVLIALQMNGHSNPDAVNYLESQLNSIKNDLFVLAVTTYSLALAKSLKKETAAQLLKNLSRNKDGLIYWQRSPTGKVDAKLESQSQVITKPIDVETASYLLLTSVIDGALEDATPVARWLAAQRNSLGGFSSSKDTVMGIQALGAYAEATFTTDLDIEVSIEQMGRKHRVKVNRNNSIATQKLQLDDLFSPVVVEATGYGVAFVQLSGLYNVLHPKQLTPFLCEKSVYQPTAKDLILEICCKSNLPNDGGKMALMLVKSLSGYSLIAEQLGSLTESVTELQRVEVLNDTQASLYFSSIGSTPVCLNVSSRRMFAVADQKPSRVQLINYYEPNNQVELFYSPVPTELSQLCDSNCWMDDSSAVSSLKSQNLVTQLILFSSSYCLATRFSHVPQS